MRGWTHDHSIQRDISTQPYSTFLDGTSTTRKMFLCRPQGMASYMRINVRTAISQRMHCELRFYAPTRGISFTFRSDVIQNIEVTHIQIDSEFSFWLSKSKGLVNRIFYATLQGQSLCSHFWKPFLDGGLKGGVRCHVRITVLIMIPRYMSCAKTLLRIIAGHFSLFPSRLIRTPKWPLLSSSFQSACPLWCAVTQY